MLGAIARVTGWVSLDSVMGCFKNYFHGELLNTNVKLAGRGYEGVRISTPRVE
jgi:Pyruvate/2-oxoacid:ferredoxin oxidoreductase gamma subunit